MPKYTLTVCEVREYQCTYTVEADSPEEAKELAALGETIDEYEDRCIGVTSRELGDDLKELPTEPPQEPHP